MVPVGTCKPIMAIFVSARKRVATGETQFDSDENKVSQHAVWHHCPTLQIDFSIDFSPNAKFQNQFPTLVYTKCFAPAAGETLSAVPRFIHSFKYLSMVPPHQNHSHSNYFLAKRKNGRS